MDFLNNPLLSTPSKEHPLLPFDYKPPNLLRDDDLPSSFTFDLTSLVCGQYQGTISDFVERELKLRGDSCNKSAGIIATNLVKVAASRIFSDPTQCILEILRIQLIHIEE